MNLPQLQELDKHDDKNEAVNQLSCHHAIDQRADEPLFFRCKIATVAPS